MVHTAKLYFCLLKFGENWVTISRKYLMCRPTRDDMVPGPGINMKNKEYVNLNSLKKGEWNEFKFFKQINRIAFNCQV